MAHVLSISGLIDQTLPHSPSNSWLLFPLIVVACTCVFVYYMYLHTRVCVCSLKYYNLFGLFAATYMYVFRAECSPQGKTVSRSPELYSVACSPLCTIKALWAFPYPCWCHPVQLMFGQLCWWDFMCVASGSTRSFPGPLALAVFSSPLRQSSLSLGC